MADVFISKSSCDDNLAFALCNRLEENGIKCWIAPRDLDTEVTNHYADDIVDAIALSRLVVLVLTNNSNHSEHCVNEVTTACDLKKKVFVVQMEEVSINKTFTYYLSQMQWLIDYDAPLTGDFSNIIANIASFLQVDDRVDYSNCVDLEYKKRSNFKKLAKKTYEKRKSLVMSIYESDDLDVDFFHVYEQIQRLDIVDSVKNTWSSYRLVTLRNDIDTPTTQMIHRECGECKISFKDMRIRAYTNTEPRQKLKVETLTKIQPNEKQIFRICFPQPLFPGESITIFYRLDWPNEPSAYYKQELTQSISLSRYIKGTDKLVFAVFEPYRILSSSMIEFSKLNEEKTSNVKPMMIDIKDEELLAPLHDKEYYGVKYVIDNPQSILYQINYIKEEISDDDDDEDDFF